MQIPAKLVAIREESPPGFQAFFRLDDGEAIGTIVTKRWVQEHGSMIGQPFTVTVEPTKGGE